MLKGLLKGLVSSIIGRSFGAALDIVKVELAITAIKLLGGIRRFVIMTMLGFFMLMLIAVGMIMIPVALCVYMPWSPETKLLVVLLFAIVYIAVPAFILMSLMAEKRWMRASGASKLVAKIAESRHHRD